MNLKINAIKLGELLSLNKKEKDKWNKVFAHYFMYQGHTKKQDNSRRF